MKQYKSKLLHEYILREIRTQLKESDSKNFASDGQSDLDIGHVDDEPGMVKADLYRIAKYAVELYKLVSHLEETGKEIDFPHWWQADIIEAKDRMINAKHYVHGELNMPGFDKMLGL